MKDIFNIVIDSRHEFTTYSEPLKNFFFTWSTNFGAGSPQMDGSTYLGFYGLFRGGMENLLGSDFFFLYVAIFSIISIAMYMLVFQKKVGATTSFFLGFFLVFNLLNFSYINEGYGIFLLYNLFIPCELLLFRKVLSNKHYLLPYGILWIFFPFTNLTISIVTYLTSLILKICLFPELGYKTLFLRITQTTIIGILTVFFVWFMYVYGLVHLTGGALEATKSETFSMTSRVSSFYNSLAGIGPWSFGIEWSPGDKALPYQDFFSFGLVKIIMILIPALSIYLMVRYKNYYLMSLLLFLWIISVAGNDGPLKNFFLSTNSSFILMFRNTFKLYVLLQMIYVLAIVLNYKKIHNKSIVYLPLVSYFLVFSVYLVFGNGVFDKSKILNIPENKKTDVEILSQQLEGRKVAILPAMHFFVYSWGNAKQPVEDVGKYDLYRYQAGPKNSPNNLLFANAISTATAINVVDSVILIKDADYFKYNSISGSVEYNERIFSDLCTSLDAQIISLNTVSYCKSVNALPGVQSSKLQDYKKLSPVMHLVSLSDDIPSQGLTDIQFDNSFNDGWRVFPAKGFSWWKAPFLKPRADRNHYMEYGYANAWNLSQEDLDSAKDDNGQVKLVLYFLPQTYFYCGLLVSGTTIFFLVIYVVGTSSSIKKLTHRIRKTKKKE